MAGFASRTGFASAVAGWVIVVEAVVARLLLRADEAQVYLLGHPIGGVCALRSRFGLPCPTCGMTRSLVLSLHGEVSRGWFLAPAGPVVLFGLLAFAAGLLVLGCTRSPGARRWMRRSALIYAGCAMVVWIGGWAASFAAAWRLRIMP